MCLSFCLLVGNFRVVPYLLLTLQHKSRFSGFTILKSYRKLKVFKNDASLFSNSFTAVNWGMLQLSNQLKFFMNWLLKILLLISNRFAKIACNRSCTIDMYITDDIKRIEGRSLEYHENDVTLLFFRGLLSLCYHVMWIFRSSRINLGAVFFSIFTLAFLLCLAPVCVGGGSNPAG